MTVVPRDRTFRYDVAIVGAGACGCEAAVRLADAGFEVVVVTTSLDTVFGTPEERVRASAPVGTLMDEVLADLEVDEDGRVGAWELHGAAKYRLEADPRIHLVQSSVDALVVRDGRVVGVETWEGVPRTARSVVLCVGSFLRARLRLGHAEERAGRPGEMAYDELAEAMAALGIRTTSETRQGGGHGRPAWTVRFERIDVSELEGYAVRRLEGLYAAGVCRTDVDTYGEAAREGQRVAMQVGDDLGVRPASRDQVS